MADNEIRLAVGEGDSNSVAITVGAKLGNKKKIHKLPPHLRSKEDSDLYDPKVVSIGPYHHGKPELQLVQGIKRNVLDHFIQNSSSQRQDYEFYFKKMLEVVHMARSCYILDDDDEEFDDDQFAEMMLLDACFLLNHLLITTVYGDDVANTEALEYYSPLDITTLIDAAAGVFFTERDTLLLDNQIPLWIIQLLFNARYGNANPLHKWKRLLSMKCKPVLDDDDDDEEEEEEEEEEDEEEEEEEALHLLEFYHMQIVRRPSSSAEDAGIGSTPIMSMNEIIDEYGYLFRSVMDLKSKGIHFRRNNTDYYSPSGIKFESNLLRAKLMLPSLDASTIGQVFLQNMIAYELCNFYHTEFLVGSYINFMKSLIVSPGDVKELREKGIIKSTIGEDKEVVKLFHKLNTYDVDNPIVFRDVKRKILKYYNSKTKTWMAELAHTYFRSPWTAIALFAATFLLVLTFLQTYFTINRRGHS